MAYEQAGKEWRMNRLGKSGVRTGWERVAYEQAGKEWRMNWLGKSGI